MSVLSSPGTFTYFFNSDVFTAVLNPTNFDVFLDIFSTESIEFVFSAFANTIIDSQVNDGTGVFINTFNSGITGLLEVDYNFGPPAPTEVSAPSALNLMSLAFIGMFVRRKKHLHSNMHLDRLVEISVMSVNE